MGTGPAPAHLGRRLISFAKIARRYFRNPTLRVVDDGGIQFLVADRPIAMIRAEGAVVERCLEHEAVDRFCAEVISAGRGPHAGQAQVGPEEFFAQSDDDLDRPGW